MPIIKTQEQSEIPFCQILQKNFPRVSFEWLHHRIFLLDLKVRTALQYVSIIMTLGVKGLIYNTILFLGWQLLSFHSPLPGPLMRSVLVTQTLTNDKNINDVNL